MKKAFLLGANGFIGKNIIDKYLENDNEIILLNRKQDKLDTKYQQNPKIRIIEGELNDIDLIKSTIKNVNVEVVIHLVSSLIPPSSIDEFHNEISLITHPTFKIIDFLCRENTEFVFFSSGGTIYGESDKPLRESHKIEPINYYGYSKLMIEQYMLFKHRCFNFRYLILRPSNLFGKYQRLDGKQGFIAVNAKKILEEKEIEIWGDGNTVRDYIDVSDVVDGLFKLLNKKVINETFNIGSGSGYNQLEIIRIIENNLNKKAMVVFKDKRSVDVDYMVLNIGKLKSNIVFDPLPIEHGIKKFIKSILPHAK